MDPYAGRWVRGWKWVGNLLLLLALAAWGYCYFHFRYRDPTVDGVGNLISFRVFTSLDPSRLLYVPLNRLLIPVYANLFRLDMVDASHLINITMGLAALAFVCLGLRRVFEDWGVALLGMCLMAAAPGFWLYSELIEVHTLNLFAVAFTFWAIVGALRRGVNPDRAPWRQERAVARDLLLAFLGALLVLATHISGVFWWAAVGGACFLSPDFWRCLFGSNRNRAFCASLVLPGWVLVVLGIAVVWTLRDEAYYFYLNRRVFWGMDLQRFGWMDGIRSSLDASFGRSFLLSVFAVGGAVRFFASSVPLFIKNVVGLALLIHFGFLTFWVSDEGAFYLPLYPILLTFSLIAIVGLFRGTKSGYPKGYRVVLALISCALFFRAFYWEGDLFVQIIALALSGAVGYACLSSDSSLRFRRVPVYLVLLFLIVIQASKSAPEIRAAYLNKAPIEKAQALAQLCGPNGAAIVTPLAVYVGFYTDCPHLRVSLAVRGVSGETPYDDYIVSRIEVMIGQYERVYLSDVCWNYLQANAAEFPKTIRYLERETRMSPIGQFYYLNPLKEGSR